MSKFNLLLRSFLFLTAISVIYSCATFKDLGKNIANGVIEGVEESKLDSTVSVLMSNILDSLELQIEDNASIAILKDELKSSLDSILTDAELKATAINDSLIGKKASHSIELLSETISKEIGTIVSSLTNSLNDHKTDEELRKFFKRSVKDYLENSVSGLTAKLASKESLQHLKVLADSITTDLGEGLNIQVAKLADTLRTRLIQPIEDVIKKVDEVGEKSFFSIQNIILLILGGILLIGTIFYLYRMNLNNRKLNKQYSDSEKILEIAAKNISEISDDNVLESVKEGVSRQLSGIGLEENFRYKLAEMGIIETSKEKMLYQTILDEVTSDSKLKARLVKSLEDKGLQKVADSLD